MDAALPSPPHQAVGFNLGLIALGAAIFGLALAYVIDGAVRPETRSTEAPLALVLAGQKLAVPRAWLDADAQPTERFVKQIGLVVALPMAGRETPSTVSITLVPRSRAHSSAQLLDSVYLHQFMSEQVAGPPGLVGKPLKAQDGFADETVWYDALSPAPFVTKCLAPAAAGISTRCLRTVHLTPTIAAIYAFDAELLSHWQRFDAELRPYLEQIGAL